MADDKKKLSSYQELLKAEADFEAGRISRREFNRLLGLFGVSAGLTAAQMNPAYAWVATHMRKGKRTSGASFTEAGLRFNAAGNAYLARTFAAPSSQTTWTWSAWVKRAAVSGGNSLFTVSGAGSGAPNTFTTIVFDQISNGYFGLRQVNGSGTIVAEKQSGVFRDPASWSHLVVNWDTTNMIAADRIRLYVNGTRLTSFTASTDPSSSLASYMNTSGWPHYLGASNLGGLSSYYDGSMLGVHFIDGQVLSPTSFGQTDSSSGQWRPKTYSGSFGSNGFYLPFGSNSSASGTGTSSGSYPNITGVSGLGADYSGNNNHWTANGVATTDQLIDVPTNNFCTLTPLDKSSLDTLSAGNLVVTGSPSNNGANRATWFLTSGKWYWETTVGTPAGSYPYVGLYSPAHVLSDTGAGIPGWGSNRDVGLAGNGGFYFNGGFSAATSAYANGDVMMVAFDTDTGKFWAGKNGTWQAGGDPASGGSPLTTLDVGTPYAPGVSSYNGATATFNFGQGGQSGLTYDSNSGGSFKYAPPSGFKALSTANLPAPAILKPSQYFATFLYTGNGADQRIGALIPPTAGYAVAQSLRFQSASSANLARTPASATNRKTWTWSGWMKRSAATLQCLFTANSSINDALFLNINANGTLTMNDLIVPTDYAYFTTSETFQDFSKWYHVVMTVDTTQGTATDRWKLWVDGRQITSFSSSISFPQNYDTHVNSTMTHSMGYYTGGYPYYLDGYMTEVNFVDGLALTPTSFGQTDSASGEWVPKQYSGSYGTNGFYLNFSDGSNTTAATLGKDSSGNGNNWTPSGFATTDAVLDTPTKNFATYNPVVAYYPSGASMSAGNLTIQNYVNGPWGRTLGTLPTTSGKYYFEFWTTNSTPGYINEAVVGIMATSFTAGTGSEHLTAGNYGYCYGSNANYYVNGTTVSMGTGFTNGDQIGIAYDLDNGKAWFSKNGTWLGSGNPATGTNPGITFAPGRSFAPFVTVAGGSTASYWQYGYGNFGQGGQSGLTYDSASGGSFKYTPPSGFKALCASNLPTVSSSALQTTPDLVWIKGRSGATDHGLYDSVRGVASDLASNSTAAETTQATGLSSFTKTGFTVGALAKLNTAGATYSAWSWKKGTSPGFDIVTYTGNGSDRSISHALGATPAMIIVKQRSGTGSWVVGHQNLHPTDPWDNRCLYLESLAARDGSLYVWRNGGTTGPTSSIFRIGTDGNVNTNSASYVAYLWAEISGFSKFGSYTGNGSTDGPFVSCGFRPAWILTKRIDTAGFDWRITDAARSIRNPSVKVLCANDGGAESDVTGDGGLYDMLSNGFKVRNNSGGGQNASGGTYIFAAFAEAPFKYANAR